MKPRFDPYFSISKLHFSFAIASTTYYALSDFHENRRRGMQHG